MITAVQKPFEEIYQNIKGIEKLLVLGCGSCVTVCMAGGEKEVEILSSSIRLANRQNGLSMEVAEGTIERQCDREFFDSAKKMIDEADAVISMACGVGVQFLAEEFKGKVVFPALNTKFYGATDEQGVWSERCAGCGDCKLTDFGGICPVARCSKSLMNGPCGGSSEGMCEVDPETTPCGWQLIFDRMKELGQLEKLEKTHPPVDWSSGRDGGPGRIIREDVKL
ncbi:MAG: methylenetetrahydrofolate reductase C-terminal domain-containing protein [Spirochaetales bacterium]|nr:methylenetetrahydrofolate reductase C-terminal domain-containing protein [Spirochaetales bacterium]